MKQELFERQHAQAWQAFELWMMRYRESGKQRALTPLPFPNEEFPRRYRDLCQQLALSQDRGYSHSLLTYLHDLVRRGHDILYGARDDFGNRVVRYVAGGFARDVRAHRWWVLASALLMFGPLLGMMLAVHLQPDMAYLVMSPADVDRMIQMYSPNAASLGHVAREASTDLSMFAYYIYHNVSLAFKCFAGGLTAGLLTLFALVYNGVSFGVVDMRLVQAGLGGNFHSFVVGHSGFELGAIILSGACGLRMGYTVLVPGQRTRGAALREVARSTIGMVCGMAVMLVIAALIEAFWSPLRLGLPVKLSVGAVLIALPILYFTLAGRNNGP